MVENRHQFDPRSFDDDLPGVLEVHGNATADVRLYLPQPPIRLVRVSNEHAGFKYRVHVLPVHLPRNPCLKSPTLPP